MADFWGGRINCCGVVDSGTGTGVVDAEFVGLVLMFCIEIDAAGTGEEAGEVLGLRFKLGEVVELLFCFCCAEDEGVVPTADEFTEAESGIVIVGFVGTFAEEVAAFDGCCCRFGFGIGFVVKLFLEFEDVAVVIPAADIVFDIAVLLF